MKNPMEISQICRRIYLAAATVASTLLPSPDPTQMDLVWDGFMLKWRFLVLFMEFSSLLMEFSNEELAKKENLTGEERWEKEEKERKFTMRERERDKNV